MSSRYRLLIVDDDLDTLRSLAMMLSLEGYDVMTASSGMAATVLLSEHVFDTIITDLRMPIVDGFEIARRTRALHPAASIIVTSRFLDEKTLGWIHEMGIMGLEKPYNIHQISAVLREFQTAGAEI